MKALRTDALFLGPKSENHRFLKEMLNFMMDEHIYWRRDFHPDDKAAISMEEQQDADYLATLSRTQEALEELSGKLKTSSMPWFSPRYLGHMNSDVLMSATLGYLATILYNPNNCAYEGSPATTALEIEVGRQLAGLMGYDTTHAWGHITSGGTVANYEGLWIARNLKSVPLAVKAVAPELVKGMDDWQLLNMSVEAILDLADQTKKLGKFEEMRAHSVRGTGVEAGRLGKLLVPQSKHYSWTKAADVLGIGQDNMVSVQVSDKYRMDIDHLKEVIDECIANKTPILAVMSVVGTTEEGAVDEVHEVVKLREAYAKQGISFYLHVDAAYGGYARAMFLNEDGGFMEFDHLQTALDEQGIIPREVDWPARDVYDAFKAMSHANSITVDPHKMGYVPYAAGAVVFKDKRVLDLVSYFAAYVFEKSEDNPMLLGSYIMEGSKAGATAAAVWTAHRVIPLNVSGYGRIIGRGIDGANHFYGALLKQAPFEVDGTIFTIEPLTRPDFNIVDFALNIKGNTDLDVMNDLNQRIYDQCSYKSGPVYADDWITSKTSLSHDDYGDAPQSFTERLGIPVSEWDRVKSVYVLRSCVLTPWIASRPEFASYWGGFMDTIKAKAALAAQQMQQEKR